MSFEADAASSRPERSDDVRGTMPIWVRATRPDAQRIGLSTEVVLTAGALSIVVVTNTAYRTAEAFGINFISSSTHFTLETSRSSQASADWVTSNAAARTSVLARVW